MRGKELTALVGLGLAVASLGQLCHPNIIQPPVATPFNPKDMPPAATAEKLTNLLHPKLCARINKPEEVTNALAVGTGWVQLYAWHEHMLEPSSEFNRTLDEVERLNLKYPRLKTQVVVAPTRSLSVAGLEQLYKTLLGWHKIDAVILTNEYDFFDPQKLDYIPWQDQNPKTAAQFIFDSVNLIWQFDPNVEIVIGAPYDPNTALEPLIFELAKLQSPIGQVAYAMHAYQTTDDLRLKLAAIWRILDKYKIPRNIWLTELGANESELQRTDLPPMIDEAITKGVKNVCLYHAAGQDEFTLTDEASKQIFDWSQAHLP